MSLSIATHIYDSYYRPIIPVQMKKPNGTWSSSILFNFDTGATQATDVPLDLVDDFGGPVATDDRVEQANDIRIPGFGTTSGTVMSIPVMVQDQDHYDLFVSQPPPIRFPLARAHDLMPYMSIIYEKTQTTLRPISLGTPTEITTPGTCFMPTASQRSGAPTSAWYWTQGQTWGGQCRTVTDWLSMNTGERRFIIKRSLVDAIRLSPLTPTSDPDEYDALGNFIYSEANPDMKLTGVPITVRDDSASFGRGGPARNLMGGENILNSYKVVVYGQNLAFVPV
jgi:hypothetical protein